MENEFKHIMSERTDEELIKIVTVDSDKYKSIAREAAQIEIENRNIDVAKFDKIKSEAIIHKEQIKKIDSNVVNSGIRFINLIIDSVVWYILIIIVFFIFGLLIPDAALVNDIVIVIINLVLVFGTFFAYHSLMEIKFQKTLGKFATKTKVVKLNGEKPENSDIIHRTFCRLIPFDRISFLFTKNGIHDFLSKTKVIKDTEK
ncbi:RDD family protein [Aquimarina sp. 2-A2]|uniref:RDD family protein n=1 Tax=Aquimarina sp. 2-A2 TaxID=3382644 RepID=UPI00387F0FDF